MSKKRVGLALILSMANIYNMNYVEAVIEDPYRFSSTNPVEEDFDVKVKISGSSPWSPGYGLYATGNREYSIAPGKSVKIDINPDALSGDFAGIYVDNGASLKLDKLTIVDKAIFADMTKPGTGSSNLGSVGLSNYRGNKLEIGNNAVIKTGNSAVVTSGSTSFIEFGENAHLESTVFGTGDGTVKAYNGEIVVGKNSTIINDGREMDQKGDHIGVYATQEYGQDDTVGRINIKDGSSIFTYGSNRNFGVLAGSSSNERKGIVNLGKNVTIKTEGDNSYGIYTQVEGSKVIVDSGGVITTNGKNSYAVVASLGGDVRFIGDQTISGSNLDGEAPALAIYASGKSDIEKSEVTADGKLIINGNLFSDNYGIIDLTLKDKSVFTGGAYSSSNEPKTGVINLAMDSGSKWNMTGNSAINKLDFIDAGEVSFNTDIDNDGYGVLSIKNLLGDGGQFTMRTDIQGSRTDYLEITESSSGNHLVTIQNRGSADVDGTERLTMIHTNDGIATFEGKNEVELGGYVYSLGVVENSENKDWELSGRKKRIFYH